MKRIIAVAAISGIISCIISAVLFLFVAPSGWLLLLIPIIMGTCIHKFGHITVADVEKDEKLEKKVGLICAGAVLFFVLLTVVPMTIIGIKQGLGWSLLWDLPFYLACLFAVWYGYNRGVQAVVDSYLDNR